MQEGSRKAIVAAFSANAGIAVAKFVGFFFTGASSMLAEAVHSVADAGNQGLLLLGSAWGRQPENEARPFGHGRERYFWSFVVALVIFMLGGVFAIYEGVHKLTEPTPVASPWIAVGILTMGVLLEGWSFWTAVKAARLQRGDRTWLEYYRQTKAAELPVILLEDLGALVGLVVALAGVGLASLTGEPRWDAAGSIVIGVLLTAIAVALSIKMRSLLVGEAATDEHVATLQAAMLTDPHIQRVLHMRTTHLGPDKLLVGAKAEFSSDLSFAEISRVINAAESRMRDKVPIARYIYIEPDLPR